MWHHVGRAPTKATHVGEEFALLALPEVAPAHAVARRALEDRFVDVRDVLRVTNGSPARLEMTNEDVECEERARVTEVRRVVGRDTADVESDGTGTRTEPKDRAPARVVETEH